MIFFVPQPHHQGTFFLVILWQRKGMNEGLFPQDRFFYLCQREILFYEIDLIIDEISLRSFSFSRTWTNLSFFSQLEYIGLKSSWPKRPRKSSKVCPRPRNYPSYTYLLFLFSRSSSVCQYYQLVPDGDPKILWHARRAFVFLWRPSFFPYWKNVIAPFPPPQNERKEIEPSWNLLLEGSRSESN